MSLYEGIGMGITTDKLSVVLDIGSAYTKYGFTGESAPRGFIKSEVTFQDTKKTIRLVEHLYDEDLYSILVEFIHHLYYRKLLVSPKDRRVVIVESLLCPTVFRDTLAKVFFRHFEVASLFFLPSHLAALCTLGLESALVVDVGYSETVVIPIYARVPVLHSWQAQPFAAKAVESRIRSLMQDSVKDQGDTIKNEIISKLSDEQIEDIKVRTCFVTTLDRAKRIAEGQNIPQPPSSVEYPVDGSCTISIPGTVREHAFEVLFERDNDMLSVAALILNALIECSIDIRRTMAQNIFLIGGTSMTPGFRARLLAELKDLLSSEEYKHKLPLGVPLKFHRAPAKDNYTSWLGGSICGATEAIIYRSLTKETYLKALCVPDWSNMIYNQPTKVAY